MSDQIPGQQPDVSVPGNQVAIAPASQSGPTKVNGDVENQVQVNTGAQRAEFPGSFAVKVFAWLAVVHLIAWILILVILRAAQSILFYLLFYNAAGYAFLVLVLLMWSAMIPGFNKTYDCIKKAGCCIYFLFVLFHTLAVLFALVRDPILIFQTFVSVSGVAIGLAGLASKYGT